MYLWDGVGSETEATQIGGTAEIVPATETTNLAVGAKQNGNFCLKINKGYTSSGGPYFIGITLDEAVNAGDEVRVIYFRTKETSTYVLGMDFSADAESASDTYQILSEGDPQVFTSTEALEEVTFVVPDGVENAKYMRVYRRNGSTGVWIPKLQVVKGSGEPPVPADTYTVAGGLSETGAMDDPVFGTSWDAANTANDMTLEATSGLYVWEKADIELEAGQVLFKVVKNHEWIESWPEENWVLNIEEAGTYTIKITFDAESKDINAIATKKADPIIPTGGFVKVSSVPESWEGDYLIVYEDESVAFNGGLETLDAAKNNIAVTITDGVIEATDENMAAIFSIEALEEGGYAVKAANGQYIGVSTYGNGLKQSDNPFEHNTPSLDEEGNATLSISKEGWEGDMILNFNSNANDKRFRYYKNGSQKKIALYKLTEESDEPAILASNIALGEIETESDVYETELTLTVKGKNLDSPIAFESSNSEIAAVSGQLDETGGTLTVNIAAPASEEGTELNETITLTSDNVVKVISVTAVVKKVVPVPPTGKKYILADIENIAPDQSVIIAMETNYGAKATINVFAMSIPENASTAPAAVSVTAEDGAIITDATDIFWNIAKNEDGNYLIYPDGTTEKSLHCIKQNNGVRVGTGEANTFDIQQAEEAQGGGMYLHNIGNNRYLGIYNSADWRCYETVNNNIKNQNLRFYVYSGTTAIDNTEVMEKATKFIQNGHLFIIKGDRIYNVMGQIIR